MSESERFKMVLEYLKGQRRIHNQSDLAKLLDKQRSYISEILNGNRKISEHFVSVFCSVFNDINPNWLLTGEGDMKKENQEPAKNGAASREIELLRELLKEKDARLKEQEKLIALMEEKVERLADESEKFTAPSVAIATGSNAQVFKNSFGN